jgi:hypothetical protein
MGRGLINFFSDVYYIVQLYLMPNLRKVKTIQCK